MPTDLDPLDEIFTERAANNARAGVKFQPKAKPRPRQESSAPLPSTQSIQVVDIAKDELTALVCPSLASSEILETKKPLNNNEDSVSGVYSSNDSAFVNPSWEHVVIGETLGQDVGLHSDVNGDWHSTIGKSAGESADIFFGLESLDDFYSQSTTATANAANKSLNKVDLSVQRGNEFATSFPVNNDAEGSLVSSEMPTVQVSDTRSAEEGPLIPVASPCDDSGVRLSNASSANTCPDVTIAQDPFTCGEAVVSNSDGDVHVDNRRLEIEEAEAIPCLETLDSLYELTTRSGQRSRKFQPKPKAQSERVKPTTITSHPDGVESIPCFQDAQCFPSESEYMNEGSIPAFPPNNVLDFSSLRFGDSTSELPGNEEPTRLVETFRSDAFIPGEQPEAVPEILEKVSQSAKRRKRKTPVPGDSLEHQKASISGQENEAGRSTRQLRKRINACELLDESEDEAHDDGDFTNECPSDSSLDEDDNDDGDYQVDNETSNKRGPRKSNKSAPQKEKPVRKRKKVNEVPDQATKEPPKKFSHSTRRKRRQVDKALLETPDDEIDVRKLPIRDLILLADYRERISSKEEKTSEAPSTNQSAGHSFADYNEDENFASEQGGGSSYDQTNPTVQECSTYTNYQSYMNKTPRARWSKQDTELFYEAVEQFGSDISMIQQLFPSRTRTQVKLKYKKEERQHPSRLHDALTTRAKDHSHFQLVIEHLQQLAAQEKQNSYRDDSIGLTGDEEEVNPKINEEVAKPEQVEEEVEEAMEPDVSEVQSPVKSHDSEDDLGRWSQYKSEL